MYNVYALSCGRNATGLDENPET